MNTYKVNVMDRNGNGLGAVRVTAADKAAVPAEAAKAMVRFAKEFNAKYDTQGIAGWQRRSENNADYVAWGAIRKVAAKKIAA